MEGIDRTIARRIFIRLFLGALLAAVLLPTADTAALKPTWKIEGAKTWTFPERIHGTSVAIAPDGSPWFGVRGEAGASLGHLQSGKLEVEASGQEGEYEGSDALQFDSQGALWYLHDAEDRQTVSRRDPNGTDTKLDLPEGEQVNALTVGPEGDFWFVRGGYGEETEAQVGRITPTGEVTQWPLETGAHPTSITVGPDGALWFSEEYGGKIGRISTSGEIQLFALDPKTQPRQIVVGPDGALWFGENGQARKYGQISNRIGRITTEGQVSEFPVPFGTGTTRLVTDPRGVIWFATDAGTLSSIAPSGNIGAPGCAGSCGDPIESLALAPDGSLWFAAGHAPCYHCGGLSSLMLDNEGTTVGKVPAEALAPADPEGPPAEDPYAHQPDSVPPPIARTGKAVDIGRAEAIVFGRVNPRGSPATWLLKWGKTKKYGHHGLRPEFPFRAGAAANGIEELIGGLCPGTTYHYALFAYGPGGRTSGGDRTLTTKPAPHLPERCRKH